MNPLTREYSDLQITLIIGAPGSGKGTLCKLLATRQNAYHLSVGDYRRELDAGPLREGSAFGNMSKSQLHAHLIHHELIPANKIIRILWHKIGMERANGHKKFLIDGFPRDEDSGWMFEQMMFNSGCLHQVKIIFFDCPEDVCRARFLGRRREATDSEEVFEKRYWEFEEKNNVRVLHEYGARVLRVYSGGTTEETEGLLFGSLEKHVGWE